MPTAHPSSPSTQLNEVHIFFPGPDSASALLLCTELVHLHPPSPSLHLPAISAWSRGAIPREYHIRCHNTRQIVQQCREGHAFNTNFYIFPNVHSEVSVEMYQYQYQAGSDRHRDRIEIPNNPMKERSSAAPAVRQLRQLQHDLSTGFENFSIRNAEAAIYNVFVCFDLVPQQLVTLYVF